MLRQLLPVAAIAAVLGTAAGAAQADHMGRMHDEQNKLAAQLDTDAPDSAAIGKQYQRIQDLQRQLVESSIDARNRMQAVLTEEQKRKLREFRHHYGMWG